MAVLAVIAYHAGLPIPGGFTGVDIFFVISGFVITEMLLREKQRRGKISLTNFYARRFKRLMPALAVMVAFTVIASALLLSNLGPQQIAAQTGLGAMLFVANIVIAKTTGNYFDAPAESNPLLHTWSLSVEEQFYFIFPLVLVAVWSISRFRSSKHGAFVAISIISILSFGVALFGSRGYGYLLGENAWLIEFYSPFTRVWEFGVGALVAIAGITIASVNARARMLSSLIAVVGVLLIITGFFAITSDTPFPGFWTLLPVSGTLLLIVAGTTSNSISAGLSTHAMVKVGDWSYSLYLWHWPFIVFAILIWPVIWFAPLVAALVSFIPALMSYYLVEQRIRFKIFVGLKGKLTTIALVFGIPIVISGLVISASANSWAPGFQSQLNTEVYPGEIGWETIASSIGDQKYPCAGFDPPYFPGRADQQISCIQSQPNSDIDFAVIGDSHAYMLYPALIRTLPNLTIALMDAQGVPDTSNEKFIPILDYINSKPTITTVLLQSFWGLRGVNEQSLTQTLRILTENDKTPIVTDDIPEFPFPPARCKFKTALLLEPECAIPREVFDASLEQYLPAISASVAAAPGSVFVKTSDVFCNKSECSMLSNGIMSFSDPVHVNLDGATALVETLISRLGSRISAEPKTK